ncbi:hypothetical protein [Maribacter dokdonensis]|nr:hypothetical protein [Maribacter dokdonensis]
MKKILEFPLTLLIFITLLSSCSNDQQELEVLDSLNAKASTAKDPCLIDGPECGGLNQLVTFTYDNPTNNPSITWSVVSGNLTLVSGQGTTAATFRIGTSFRGGGSVNVTSGICNLTRDILYCPSNDCGITLNSLNEVNALGSNEVAFYVVPSLESGWSIDNSTFTVTRDSGIISNHSGYLNSNGHPQIIINVPCSPQSGRIDKVSVVVNASSSSQNCSKSIEKDFMSVCGTGF